MKLFNKVAIIGTGLIGGSLALAIKTKGIAAQVVGVSRKKATLAEAKKIGAIDEGSQGLGIIRGADLVVLATPVEAIIGLAPRIKGLISRDCIVIDVGSTKNKIVSCLDKIFPYYVGTHPLAGSEKRGIDNAAAGIFKGSLCILTPVKSTDPQVIRKIKAFWEKLGARTMRVPPGEHDRILSFTSHLPHTCAFSLINALPEKYLKFCAGSFKDATRIAASNPGLWADIFLSNRKNMLTAIEVFEGNIARVKKAIKDKNKRILIKILKDAGSKRNNLSDTQPTI